MDAASQELLNRAGPRIVESVNVDSLAERLRHCHFLSERSLAELRIKPNVTEKWSFLMTKIMRHPNGVHSVTDALVKLHKPQLLESLNPISRGLALELTQPLTKPDAANLTFRYELKDGYSMELVLSTAGGHASPVAVARVVKATSNPPVHIALTKAQLSVLVQSYDVLPHLQDQFGEVLAGFHCTTSLGPELPYNAYDGVETPFNPGDTRHTALLHQDQANSLNGHLALVYGRPSYMGVSGLRDGLHLCVARHDYEEIPAAQREPDDLTDATIVLGYSRRGILHPDVIDLDFASFSRWIFQLPSVIKILDVMPALPLPELVPTYIPPFSLGPLVGAYFKSVALLARALMVELERGRCLGCQSGHPLHTHGMPVTTLVSRNLEPFADSILPRADFQAKVRLVMQRICEPPEFPGLSTAFVFERVSGQIRAKNFTDLAQLKHILLYHMLCPLEPREHRQAVAQFIKHLIGKD